MVRTHDLFRYSRFMRNGRTLSESASFFLAEIVFQRAIAILNPFLPGYAFRALLAFTVLLSVIYVLSYVQVRDVAKNGFGFEKRWPWLVTGTYLAIVSHGYIYLVIDRM